MENQRFDELTRRFARPMSRRQAFKVLVASVLGGAFSGLGGDLARAASCPQPLCAGTCCPTGAGCKNGKCTCSAGQQVCPNGRNGFCAKKCCAYNTDNCSSVPSGGAFSVSVPKTQVRLTGVGTPRAAGSVVSVARVTAPHLPKHAQAFKLVASGHIPPLKLAAKGSLSQLIVSRDQWKSIEAITGSGIYAAFFA